MKPLVCLYHEGNDTKVAVVSFEEEKMKLLKVADFDVVQPQVTEVEKIAGLNLDSDMLTNNPEQGLVVGGGISAESLLNSALQGIKLANCEFIQAITEPAIHYHIFEGSKDVSSGQLTQDIIEDIQKTKHISISKENLAFTELTGGSLLTVFADGELSCIRIIDALAHYNGKRFFKIAAIKSSEISLSYYVAKKKKFFPDDYSLIVYVGKEYSKLIFLQGKKLKHIGATLDVGTSNLHTYDVYFSKILLEMENGGIPRLDNVVLCGEDESENLILSFYGTFPEANVSKLEFDDIDTSLVEDVYKEKLSSFSVPLAIAQEYIDEQEHEYLGINLLPQYVKEEQKHFQFGWHSFVVLGLLFVATFYFTSLILDNFKKIRELNKEVNELTMLQQQNRMLLNQINDYETKVNSFDATQSVLDEASTGVELWGKMFKDMSNFMSSRENMWVSSIGVDNNNKVEVTGYGLSRSVLTAFADSYGNSFLNSITQEKISKANTFKCTINFDLSKLSEKRP
jgi:hypothetical protein